MKRAGVSRRGMRSRSRPSTSSASQGTGSTANSARGGLAAPEGHALRAASVMGITSCNSRPAS
eukprot:scaffold219368_cov33-Tisochrysis_lutea.AAC.3